MARSMLLTSLPVTPLLAVTCLATCLQAQKPRHIAGDMVGEIMPDPAGGFRAMVLVVSHVPATATVYYSTKKSVLQTKLSSAARIGPVKTSDALTAKVDLTGLKPGTKYYYLTRLANASKPSLFSDGAIGELTTPPVGPAVVRFAFSADVAWTFDFPLLTALANDRPAFYLSLGDFPYCDAMTFNIGLTLANYRLAHAIVRTLPDVQRFFHRVPIFAILDDHEVLNDWDESVRIGLPWLAKLGRQAFSDWFPLRPVKSGVFYRTFPWGKGLRVFMLDTRSHRGFNGGPDLDKPMHSILGAEQRAWLKRELELASETFKVIVTSVPLRSGFKAKDHWAGYQRERRELFDFIQDKQIRNVVFVSGDHHLAAVNHHRDGFIELLAGPLNSGFHVPPGDRLDEMRWDQSLHNWGLVTVDTTVAPARLTLEVRDGLRTVFRHVLEDVEPGEVEFSAGLGDARIRLDGPQFLFENGAGGHFRRVAPGKYRVTAQSQLGAAVQFPTVDLDVLPGGYASVGVLPPITPKLEAQRLLSDDFNGNGSVPKTLVADLGTGPSAWFTDDGYLWQSSFIKGSASLPGTIYFRGDPTWTDQVIRTRVRSWWPGQLGVVFRYRDPSNYYIFQLFRDTRTLAVVQNGVRRVLASDRFKSEPYRNYEIECSALGVELSVKMNGEAILSATDTSHAKGRVGLATSDNALARFDRLRVFRRPVDENIAFADFFSGVEPEAWTAHDAGTIKGPSRWLVPVRAAPIPGGSVMTGRSVVRQTSSIQSTGPDRAGTILVRAGDHRDFVFSSSVKGGRTGGIGVVFRVRSPDSYYRFHMDDGQGFRRLDKVIAGRATTLASQSVPFAGNPRWRPVEIVALRDRLSVRLDGAEILSARDGTLTRGGIGFYCFRAPDASFDNVVVQRLTGQAEMTTITGKSNRFRIELRSPNAAGDLAMLLLSTGTRPPLDLSRLDPLGRLLPLKPGAIFRAFLTPANLARFDNESVATFTIRFPPGLKGLRLFAGGVRLDPKRSAVLPLASAPVRL